MGAHTILFGIRFKTSHIQIMHPAILAKNVLNVIKTEGSFYLPEAVVLKLSLKKCLRVYPYLNDCPSFGSVFAPLQFVLQNS